MQFFLLVLLLKMQAAYIRIIKETVTCPHVELEQAIEWPMSLYQDCLLRQWIPTWQLLCKEGHSGFEILSVVHEHAMQLLRILSPLKRGSSAFIDLQSVHVYMMMFSVHVSPICSYFIITQWYSFTCTWFILRLKNVIYIEIKEWSMYIQTIKSFRWWFMLDMMVETLKKKYITSGWYKLAAQIQNIAFINHLELIAADFNWRSKNLKKCRRGSLVYTLQPFV